MENPENEFSTLPSARWESGSHRRIPILPMQYYQDPTAWTIKQQSIRILHSTGTRSGDCQNPSGRAFRNPSYLIPVQAEVFVEALDWETKPCHPDPRCRS